MTSHHFSSYILALHAGETVQTAAGIAERRERSLLAGSPVEAREASAGMQFGRALGALEALGAVAEAGEIGGDAVGVLGRAQAAPKSTTPVAAVARVLTARAPEVDWTETAMGPDAGIGVGKEGAGAVVEAGPIAAELEGVRGLAVPRASPVGLAVAGGVVAGEGIVGNAEAVVVQTAEVRLHHGLVTELTAPSFITDTEDTEGVGRVVDCADVGRTAAMATNLAISTIRRAAVSTFHSADLLSAAEILGSTKMLRSANKLNELWPGEARLAFANGIAGAGQKRLVSELSPEGPGLGRETADGIGAAVTVETGVREALLTVGAGEAG